MNILVAQFILSYKQHFFDQVVAEIRPELICGSVVYGCFKKFPDRGPEVAGLGCGLRAASFAGSSLGYVLLLQ